MDGLEIIKVGESVEDVYGYTAVDSDLFLPRGMYKVDKGVDIIFDSGCTHVVAPHGADFVGHNMPVTKVINVLGTSVNIIGEETIVW